MRIYLRNEGKKSLKIKELRVGSSLNGVRSEGTLTPKMKEIALAIQEMRDHLAVVRLELAAAASGAENADAIVRVTPVGEGGGPWAQQLLHMYTAWAERTGRKTDPSCNPNELRINGLATRDLLDGENGIHRHVGPEGRELHARVLVLSHDGSSEQQDDAWHGLAPGIQRVLQRRDHTLSQVCLARQILASCRPSRRRLSFDHGPI